MGNSHTTHIMGMANQRPDDVMAIEVNALTDVNTTYLFPNKGFAGF